MVPQTATRCCRRQQPPAAGQNTAHVSLLETSEDQLCYSPLLQGHARGWRLQCRHGLRHPAAGQRRQPGRALQQPDSAARPLPTGASASCCACHHARTPRRGSLPVLYNQNGARWRRSCSSLQSQCLSQPASAAIPWVPENDAQSCRKHHIRNSFPKAFFASQAVTRTALEDAQLVPAAVTGLRMQTSEIVTQDTAIRRPSSARHWRTHSCFQLPSAAWRCTAPAPRWATPSRSAPPAKSSVKQPQVTGTPMPPVCQLNTRVRFRMRHRHLAGRTHWRRHRQQNPIPSLVRRNSLFALLRWLITVMPNTAQSTEGTEKSQEKSRVVLSTLACSNSSRLQTGQGFN